MSELYQLTFPNGKSYIGVTEKTARERFRTHVHQRQTRRYAVYAAIRHYGAASVRVRTLVIGKIDYLMELERQAIEAFGTKAPNGYNLTDGGEVPRGLTAESLAKMSAVHKGKAHHCVPHSAEAKARMSASHKGRPKTDQHRRNISSALMGNKRSLGKTHSVETRAKMSASHKGIIFSERHRANISAAAKLREQTHRQSRTHL